ncbi:ADK2 GTP:AMP phosphotransferase [Candida maltosa Xu316]|uniref:GTP:AMP phosphotransferase, mitochondrial n=1 Tax=Candida maltosa (strain Xu316) TaxID=1245528 RepID=M3HJ86_CANMX|nr:Adenylate kinase 2 [Candida maltosa Xu316]
MNPLRILLLGAPGSGKGTQTSKLLKKFHQLKSLSSGDILRSQIKQESPIGIEAEKYIKNGSLVPDSIMVGIITHQLEQSKWLNKQSSWLLDGFPRTIHQATALHQVIKEKANFNLVVELDVDQNVILDRIEARWVHVPSGRVYSLDYNPPKVPFKDDITGEPLTKREDDTAEVFQKRLTKYNEEIGPLKDFYSKQGILQTVSGNTSDVIYPKLENLIVNRFS